MRNAPQDMMKAHLREDIEKVEERELRAMFETSAEMLGGFEKAFQHRVNRHYSGPVVQPKP
jgi:hypothetical protein